MSNFIFYNYLFYNFKVYLRQSTNLKVTLAVTLLTMLKKKKKDVVRQWH